VSSQYGREGEGGVGGRASLRRAEHSGRGGARRRTMPARRRLDRVR
jgi:hypothetical protein